VENFNGLVRQYLPKGCDLRRVDAEEVKKVQDEINRRPRKVLGFHRPIYHENKLAARSLALSSRNYSLEL
jgi:IS30 family transposase